MLYKIDLKIWLTSCWRRILYLFVLTFGFECLLNISPNSCKKSIIEYTIYNVYPCLGELMVEWGEHNGRTTKLSLFFPKDVELVKDVSVFWVLVPTKLQIGPCAIVFDLIRPQLLKKI